MRRRRPPAIGRVIAEVMAINHARQELERLAADRPITARPVGAAYAVRTRGRVPEDERGRKLERESLDTVAAGAGCFRRVPTCRD